jgi:hypothetical protein
MSSDNKINLVASRIMFVLLTVLFVGISLPEIFAQETNTTNQTTNNTKQSELEKRLIEAEREIERLRQQEGSENTQQEIERQPSNLTTYTDAENDFTIEYDPNLWFAIPDFNRFDEIEVSFGDKATSGNEASFTVGLMEDPLPTMNLEDQMSGALSSFQENQYDFQLEEDIECQKMSVMGYPTCSFIYSTGSYLESYPRDYFMMTSAKIEGKVLILTLTAPGGQFDEFEQYAIQMANSIRIPGVTPKVGLTT